LKILKYRNSRVLPKTITEDFVIVCVVLTRYNSVANRHKGGAKTGHLHSKLCSPPCVLKNIPDIFDCNLKTNYQILIILAGTFSTQVAIKWPFSFLPHPTFVFVLPGENTTSEISLFYSMRYDCLINITPKKHILFTFLTMWLTIYSVVHFLAACSKTA